MGEAVIKEMVKGLRVAVTLQVPGEVGENSRFSRVEGRTALFEVTDDLMVEVLLANEDARKRLESLGGTMKVRWKKNEVTAEEHAAFRKELDAAKAAWEKLRAKKDGDAK